MGGQHRAAVAVRQRHVQSLARRALRAPVRPPARSAARRLGGSGAGRGRRSPDRPAAPRCLRRPARVGSSVGWLRRRAAGAGSAAGAAAAPRSAPDRAPSRSPSGRRGRGRHRRRATQTDGADSEVASEPVRRHPRQQPPSTASRAAQPPRCPRRAHRAVITGGSRSRQRVPRRPAGTRRSRRGRPARPGTRRSRPVRRRGSV